MLKEISRSNWGNLYHFIAAKHHIISFKTTKTLRTLVQLTMSYEVLNTEMHEQYTTVRVHFSMYDLILRNTCTKMEMEMKDYLWSMYKTEESWNRTLTNNDYD
jgi:hypothetical protein